MGNCTFLLLFPSTNYKGTKSHFIFITMYRLIFAEGGFGEQKKRYAIFA